MNFEFSFVTLLQGFLHIVWPSVLCLIITKPDTYPPLGRVLSSALISMQTTAMSVVVGEMFFCPKIRSKSFGDGSQDIPKDKESNLGPVAGFSGKGKLYSAVF